MIASDGMQGLDNLDREPVDLLLLDSMVPGASGLEILSKIRAKPEGANTPIIILTAKRQDTNQEAALAGGANDLLTKPFSPKTLIARIEEILGNV